MNRLGIHVLGTQYREQVLSLAPMSRVVVLFEDAIEMACEVRRAAPDTIIVARRWFPEQRWDEPEETARLVFSKVWERVAPVKGCVDFVVGMNEPVGDFPSLIRYLRMERVYADILRRHGMRLAAVNFSRGYPDLAFWRLDEVRRLIREIVSGGNVLALHEYGEGSMENRAEWLSLRHRKVMRALGTVYPVLITETGVDGGGQGKGWRVTGYGETLEEKARNYEASLKWYADRLQEDAYVQGAAIFTVGPGWDSFDILHDFEPHLRRVLEYTPARPEGACPGVAEYIADRLERNPDPSIQFPRRSLDDIRYIAIHHTTGTCRVTPQGVARYHVRKRGWAGIGYHFWVTCDGRVYEVGDLDTQRANVWGRNREVVGIAFAGTYDDHPPTDAALSAAKRLIGCLWRKLGREVPVVGHRDIARPGHETGCPGRLWPGWKADILPSDEGGDEGNGGGDMDENEVPQTPQEWVEHVKAKAAKLGWNISVELPEHPGKDGYFWMLVDVNLMADGSYCVPITVQQAPADAIPTFSVAVRQWWDTAPQKGCDGCASCWKKGQGESWDVGVPGQTRRLCYGKGAWATSCDEEWVYRWWICDENHPSVLACTGAMEGGTNHSLLSQVWALVRWTPGGEGGGDTGDTGGEGGGDTGGDTEPPAPTECSCAEAIGRAVSCIFGWLVGGKKGAKG